MKVQAFIRDHLCRLLAGVIVLGATASFGATPIHEPFAQAAGPLGGQPGGTGLSGNWSVDQTVNVVTPTTLSYGSLENSGNQIVFSNGNSTDAWVSTSSILGDSGLLDDGASLWFSFMYSSDSSGGSNEKGAFSFGTDRLNGNFNGENMTGGGNGIGVRIRGGGLNAATWAGGANDPSVGGSASVPLNQSHLVVGRIDWGATAGDVETITAFLPSTSDLFGGLISASTTTMSGIDQTLFDTIAMTSRNSGGSKIYDEIRFGPTYSSVIPEPSVALLGGLGLLALFRRRRA